MKRSGDSEGRKTKYPLELPYYLATSNSCKPIGDRRPPQGYGGGAMTGDVAEVAIQRAYNLDEARSGTRDNTQARSSDCNERSSQAFGEGAEDRRPEERLRASAWGQENKSIGETRIDLRPLP